MMCNLWKDSCAWPLLKWESFWSIMSAQNTELHCNTWLRAAKWASFSSMTANDPSWSGLEKIMAGSPKVIELQMSFAYNFVELLGETWQCAKIPSKYVHVRCKRVKVHSETDLKYALQECQKIRLAGWLLPWLLFQIDTVLVICPLRPIMSQRNAPTGK